MLIAAAALCLAPNAQASSGAAQKLVDTYSPIVMLRAQTDICDPAQEQFEPTTVGVFLDNPQTQLDAPDGKLVTKAPTAADVAGLGDGYHLNIPGDPLSPGCNYSKAFKALKDAGKAPPITYARIATEEGHTGLVVQYWFFYYFNQFNDLHEGDWEGMQIAFDGSTPRQALATGPSEIALFQHEGGEKGSWDDPKVQKEGTHPVVYPAAGSHATFYSSAIFVENAQGGSGLGCDNTTSPVRRVEPKPVLIPTNPRVNGPFKWLTFEGRWGQKEKGYANGPHGPMDKLQWDEPFTWMSGVRDRSPQLPSGFFLGPQVTGTFCGTVATLSHLVNLEAKSTLAAAGIVVGFILLIVVLLRLTKWRPVELTPLRQERAVGQLLRAARQLYGRHWRPMVLVGLTSIPILAAVYGIEQAAVALTGETGVETYIRDAANPLGYAVVAAIAIAYLRDLELGEEASYASAFRGHAPALPEGRPRSDPQLHPRAPDRADHHRHPGRDLEIRPVAVRAAGDHVQGHGDAGRVPWQHPARPRKLVADRSRRRAPVADQRRHRADPRLRPDLHPAAARLGQHRRDDRVRPAGPVRRHRPHAPVLGSQRPARGGSD